MKINYYGDAYKKVDDLTMEDRRLLSRYGVWMVIGLCAPNNDTPTPLLGRLLGSLCNWFSSTQYLPDGKCTILIIFFMHDLLLYTNH